MDPHVGWRPEPEGAAMSHVTTGTVIGADIELYYDHATQLGMALEGLTAADLARQR
jgi:hypothetical protein